jgi:glutathione S-transferase
MTDRFTAIGAMLEETVPMTWALTRRMAALPALAALAPRACAVYGDNDCGGQIEASFGKVRGIDAGR